MDEANRKKKKRIITLSALAGIGAALLLCTMLALMNPRVRLLAATVRFATETLNNPSYIAYQVDLMELCRDYLNADTTFQGKALLDHVRKMNNSMSMEITGERSFSQKKMECIADLSVLVLHMGEFKFYAEGDMFYMIVPILNNLSYSFDTELNLFLKAPDLTSDLNLEWFQENTDNIIRFTREIRIEDAGVLADGENQGSRGYQITIPEGCGLFIWELLGITPPSHDVVFTIYLTRDCQVARVVVDLSEYLRDSAVETAVITVDGTDCGTVILRALLPDDEVATVTAKKNGEILSSNLINLTATYEAATGDLYHAEGYITWERMENGVSLKIHDFNVSRNEELLASTYFDGELKKAVLTEDVFRDVTVNLHTLDSILWKDLRNDVDGFFDDLTEEIIRRLTHGSYG